MFIVFRRPMVSVKAKKMKVVIQSHTITSCDRRALWTNQTSPWAWQFIKNREDVLYLMIMAYVVGKSVITCFEDARKK